MQYDLRPMKDINRRIYLQIFVEELNARVEPLDFDEALDELVEVLQGQGISVEKVGVRLRKGVLISPEWMAKKLGWTIDNVEDFIVPPIEETLVTAFSAALAWGLGFVGLHWNVAWQLSYAVFRFIFVILHLRFGRSPPDTSTFNKLIAPGVISTASTIASLTCLGYPVLAPVVSGFVGLIFHIALNHSITTPR
jgi:hypothetical protein